MSVCFVGGMSLLPSNSVIRLLVGLALLWVGLLAWSSIGSSACSLGMVNFNLWDGVWASSSSSCFLLFLLGVIPGWWGLAGVVGGGFGLVLVVLVLVKVVFCEVLGSGSGVDVGVEVEVGIPGSSGLSNFLQSSPVFFIRAELSNLSSPIFSKSVRSILLPSSPISMAC